MRRGTPRSALHSTPIAVAVVVVLSLVLSGVGGLAAATGSGATAQEAPDGDAELADSRIVEQQGDRLEIPIVFERGDTAVFEMFGPGWDVNLLATDGNGDGRVTVVIDSFRPDDEVAFSTRHPADTVGIRHLVTAVAPLPTGRYETRVTTTAGRDRGVLQLERAAVDGLSMHRGADDLGPSLDDLAAVTEASERGTLTTLETDGSILAGDTLVVGVDASGLGAVLPTVDASGPDAPVSFRLERAGACGGSLDLLSSSAVTLHTDSIADRHVAVIDTGAASFTGGAAGDCSTHLEPGDTLQATLTVPADSSLAGDGPQTATSDSIRVVGRDGTLSTTNVSASGGSLDGTTTLAPGSSVRLVVTTAGGTERSVRTTIGLDGRFEAAVTLSAAPFENASVALFSGFTRLFDEQVQLTPDGPALRFGDQEAADTVTVDRAALPEGGFVVLTGQNGTVIGSTGANGTVADVSVPTSAAAGERTVTAMLYRDTDSDGQFGDADEPYRRDDTPVASNATVTFSDRTADGTDASTDDTSTDDTSTDDTSTDDTSTDDTSTDDESGTSDATGDETTDDPPDDENAQRSGGSGSAERSVAQPSAGMSGNTKIGLFVGLLVVFGPVVFALREN